MDKKEIQNLIEGLVKKIAADATVISEVDGKLTWYKVEIADGGQLLARGGDGLFALNHLVRRMVEGKLLENELEFLIDVNGFQRKRIENVRAVAHMMAERARYFKSNIEVDPMPAFERRIIHEFLSEAADLRTESEGVGPSRRVVIKYVGGLS